MLTATFYLRVLNFTSMVFNEKEYYWILSYGTIQMGSGISGETLAKRYPQLAEDAEDISYRMYDLFIRRYPNFTALFGGSRNFHIQLFNSLIDTPANFDSHKATICSNKSLKAMGNHPYLIKHPDLLGLHRHCLIRAIQDVLFDEAPPRLINECRSIFNALCSKVEKYVA